MIYVVAISLVIALLCGITIYKSRTVKNRADFLVPEVCSAELRTPTSTALSRFGSLWAVGLAC